MDGVTFEPFDAADYLESEQDVAAYLEACAEGGELVEISRALGTVARARKMNMSKLARDTGLTRVGLTKALATGGNPSFYTVAKVAAGLGYAVSFRPVNGFGETQQAKRSSIERSAKPGKTKRAKGAAE